jgi:putative tryptophan/tyrosine transport system substrate-binding protein
MRRGESSALLGGAVLPLVADAQQSKPVIGFLNGLSADARAPFVTAFRQGLSADGYDEGRNVAIEYRWTDNHGAVAQHGFRVVRRPVAVLVASGGDQRRREFVGHVSGRCGELSALVQNNRQVNHHD